MLRSLNSGLPKSPADCVTCGGSPDYLDGEFGTFRWYDERGEVVEYQCHCIEQYQLRMWLTNAGIGLRYQRYGWTDAKGVSDDAQQAVLDYGQHVEVNLRGGYGLILHSVMRGTGKTLLSTLLLKTIISMGVDGYFTTFGNMLDAYTAGWRNEEQRNWFKRRITNTGFLVVDDIGRENRGRHDTSEEMVDGVIRSRVAECRPTIVTTNFTIKQIEEGYSSNIVSLLTESCVPIEVVGMDYRPRAAEQMQAEARQGLSRPVVLA